MVELFNKLQEAITEVARTEKIKIAADEAQRVASAAHSAAKTAVSNLKAEFSKKLNEVTGNETPTNAGVRTSE